MALYTQAMYRPAFVILPALMGLLFTPVVAPGGQWLRALGAVSSPKRPVPQQTDCPVCPPPPEPEQALRESEATFFGTVEEVVDDTAHPERRELVFMVLETWTTDSVGEHTVIDVPIDVWECGRRPRMGENWMVYAHRTPDQRLAMGLCDRSHRTEGPRDPDADQLGTGCDTVRSMWLDIAPAVVQVGELFTATVRTRGLNMIEMDEIVFNPPSAVTLVPPCRERACFKPLRFNFRMRAISTGTVYVGALGFGEDRQCHHGSGVWNWAHPMGTGSVLVRPAGPPYRSWLPRLDQGFLRLIGSASGNVERR